MVGRGEGCEGGIKVRGALVVVGFVLALLIGVAWLGHRDRGAGMPDVRPGELGHAEVGAGLVGTSGERIAREEMARRFRMDVAVPDEGLRERVLPEVKRLMGYHLTGSFEEYSAYRTAAGLATLPDHPFRLNHEAAAEELRKLVFHWDASEVMVIGDGSKRYFLVHDGMSAVERMRRSGMAPDLEPVTLPRDSFRVVCRVPVTFPEPTDGVERGTYCVFLSNSTPSGEWVVYRLGIFSGGPGKNFEAWRKYVSQLW